MPWDTWYDLAVRELSDLSDPAKEMLAEAEMELSGEAPGEDAPASAPPDPEG